MSIMNSTLKINLKPLIICTIILLQAFQQGCKEMDEHSPIQAGGDAPQPITNPIIKNLPGGAVVSYDLPQDKQMLYAKALYEIRPGIVREAKSTYYSNSLPLEGFGSEGDYDVKLISVGRNNNESTPSSSMYNPSRHPSRPCFLPLT